MERKSHKLENELKEKDAMIGWLLDRLEGFCDSLECLNCVYVDDRLDTCPILENGWRKAAQEAVKKNG